MLKKSLLLLLIFFCVICYSDTININTADLKKLTQLKGIGKTKALQIICYRQKNGNFLYIEDITKVKGISYKTFDKIKQNISIVDDNFSDNIIVNNKRCTKKVRKAAKANKKF